MIDLEEVINTARGNALRISLDTLIYKQMADEQMIELRHALYDLRHAMTLYCSALGIFWRDGRIVVKMKPHKFRMFREGLQYWMPGMSA